jgi:DUF4097 and DUF4098 domain-containing protein YvlB
MAAAPPPYSPRDQRRQARDYWRAQRDAARMNRQYWRSMRRPSITGPFVLVLIGVVALLLETGKINGNLFWEWYARWWPLLLIVVGVVSLLEWYLDRDQPYGRRHSGGGLVILILVLAFVGHSWHFWGPLRDQISPDDDGNFFSFMGEEHDNDPAEQVNAIPAHSNVQIQNPHGNVTVMASSDNSMRVRAHQVVRTTSDSDARRIFHLLDPKIQISGNAVRVQVDGNNDGRADLTIELPADATGDVTAGHGDVTVQGVKGPTTVNSSHGDVKLDGISGNVNAHMSKGDFSAHAIQGDLSLEGHVGDVTISDIQGKALLDGDFFGDTHLEHVGQSVHFHSSRTDVALSKLEGDLTMDSDDLHITQAAGPIRIVTRSKNIEATQVTGDIHIEDANGEVNVAVANPVGNIAITNRNQPITLTLPQNANFSINATTNEGDVQTDFPLDVTGSDSRRTVTGQVGKGGVKIELNQDHGDLRLRKGDSLSGPTAPALPGPPTPPLPPGTAKHLREPKGANAPQPSVQ